MTENAGTTATAVEITEKNIYDLITLATEALDNADVPQEGRTLTVTPHVYRMMKKSPDIILNTDIGEDMRIKGVIGNLDGAVVLKETAQRLPEGFGFMLSHNSATVAPQKLADYKIHHDPPGISGDLIEGRVVYDAFVLENKVKGIYLQPIPVTTTPVTPSQSDESEK